MKKLSEYAIDMEEDKYHSKRCLSYSILAQYERNGGFKWLPENWSDLWKPTAKTDALIFGGAVDAIITGGQDKFNSEYNVVDIPSVPEKVKIVVDKMIENGIGWNDTDRILAILDETQFYPTWKRDTRLSKLNEGLAYFNALSSSAGKLILTKDMYDHVVSVCDDLHKSKLVSSLMFDELPDTQERFFQLKFFAILNGIKFKIMCDMIIVDHENKKIRIYDLKTTGKESYNFRYSYLDFGYHIQSWLYRMVLEDVLTLTDYDDYKIDGFYFIVASKVDGEPTVWQDKTAKVGFKYRDPLVIGQEIVDSYDNDGYRKPMPKWCKPDYVNIINFD